MNWTASIANAWLQDQQDVFDMSQVQARCLLIHRTMQQQEANECSAYANCEHCSSFRLETSNTGIHVTDHAVNIAQATYWHVVADKVPVALIGVELD